MSYVRKTLFSRKIINFYKFRHSNKNKSNYTYFFISSSKDKGN